MEVVGKRRLEKLRGPDLVTVSQFGDVTVKHGTAMLLELSRLLGVRKAIKVYGIARRELDGEPIVKMFSRRAVLGTIAGGAGTLMLGVSLTANAAEGEPSHVIGDAILLEGSAAVAAKKRLGGLTQYQLLVRYVREKMPNATLEEVVYQAPVLVSEGGTQREVGKILTFAAEMREPGRLGRVMASATQRDLAKDDSMRASQCDASLGSVSIDGSNFDMVGYTIEKGVVVPSGTQARDRDNPTHREIISSDRVLLIPKESEQLLDSTKRNCNTCKKIMNIVNSGGCSVPATMAVAAACGPGALVCAVVAGIILAGLCAWFADGATSDWCKLKKYC